MGRGEQEADRRAAARSASFDNLHRNVSYYRDGKALADRMAPMTTFDGENPEDLWKRMATWEEKTSGSLPAAWAGLCQRTQ
jgi:hypothetical protein